MSGFTIMTVCTGNICRSPLAEQLLRARIGTPHQFLSSGLHAVPGAAMDENSATQSLKYGGSPGGISTQIEEDLVNQSDLILTMTQQQRDTLVSLFPLAVRKTYTLGEFAKILVTYPEALQNDGDDPFSPTNPFMRASRFRGFLPLEPHDDVADPIGQNPQVHAQVAEQISTYINQIVDVLRQTKVVQ